MQLCGQLHHPNIVRLIDFEQVDEEQLFSVFEFVPGSTLAEVLAREGFLEVSEACRLMLQVLDALACAHKAGVIHRDIKPSNLMITGTGERRNALVLDFGIGALIESAVEATQEPLTRSNGWVGTPRYLAPEQLRGRSRDLRSDYYSWGLVLLECLTGTPAIRGQQPAEILQQQLSHEPVPIPQWLRGHPLGEVLERVTAKDLESRNVDAAAVLRALESSDLAVLTRRQREWLQAVPSPTLLEQTQSQEHERLPLPPEEWYQLSATLSCALCVSPSSHAHVDIEQLDELLRLEQALCTQITGRFSGEVAGALGDQVLLHFPPTGASASALHLAARAALLLVAEVEAASARTESAQQVRLEIRVGLQTGPVGVLQGAVTSARGRSQRFRSALRLAARLHSVAAPGTIVVSDDVYRLLRGRFQFQPLGSGTTEQPPELFRLLGELPALATGLD
jgi:class 3 adenylate cyclase